MSPLLKFLLMLALEGLCIYRLRYLFRRVKIKYGEIISVEKKMVNPVSGQPIAMHDVVVQYIAEDGNIAKKAINMVEKKYVVGGKIDLEYHNRDIDQAKKTTSEIFSLIVVMVVIFLYWVFH
jgi:hypothetical protein